MSIDSCKDHSRFMVHCEKCLRIKTDKPSQMGLNVFKRYVNERVQSVGMEIERATNEKMSLERVS